MTNTAVRLREFLASWSGEMPSGLDEGRWAEFILAAHQENVVYRSEDLLERLAIANMVAGRALVVAYEVGRKLLTIAGRG